MRGALTWLGEADPFATHQAAAATDPEQAGLSMLIEAWGQVVGEDHWVTAAELISACLGDGGTVLADALDTVSTRREPKMLGKYLVRVADRIVAGRCIRKLAKSGRSAQFRMESA